MTFGHLAGIGLVIVVMAVGLTIEHVDSLITRGIAQAIGLAYVIWYFRTGIYLKGWVGQTLGEMQAELARLNSLTDSRKHPDGREVTQTEYWQAVSMRGKILQKMHEHPDVAIKSSGRHDGVSDTTRD